MFSTAESAKNARFSPQKPTFYFAGGGSGGHIYPTLALAGAFRARFPSADFVFFGTGHETEARALENAGVGWIKQPLVGISGRPWRWPAVLRGLRDARRLCRERIRSARPELVIGTGGLAAVPAVLEAASAGIPKILLNPDAVPGRANRYLARRADLIVGQWPGTEDHFPAKVRPRVRVLGCPVRGDFATANRDRGLERFGLSAERKTLLITGASQGARAINQAITANLAFLEGLGDWQVLHLTGFADFEAVNGAYAGRKVAARVLAYTDHMADALAAADLVVARAGASTLAEITAVGRASILMPYPHHRDQHQWGNAEYLARGKAARILRDRVDAGKNGPALRAVLEAMVKDDVTRAGMAEAARRLGRPDAAHKIAETLIQLTAAKAPA